VNTWLLIRALSSPFSLLVTFGAAAGLGGSVYIASRERKAVLRGGMGMLILSLIGARLEYILLHRDYFLSHVAEIPQVWLGGLGWIGALSGGLLGLGVMSWVWKRSLGQLLALYLPLSGLLALSVGLASLFGNVGYGPQTSAWWGVPLPDEFGVYTDRWPLHVVGGGLSCALTLALAVLAPEAPWFSSPGRRGSAGLLSLTAVFTAVSALRVDPGVFFRGLRIQTWGGLFYSLLAFVLFIYYVRYPDEDQYPLGSGRRG